ncbi:MAG: trypsin-like peptidase domain-containing protein [Devosia sp.]
MRIGSAVIATIVFAGFASGSLANTFGDNDLDALTRAGTPNQCYLKSGTSSPPSGRVFVVRGGSKYPMGSGDLVLHGDIAVTAGHLFRNNGGKDKLKPGDRVVFSIWEGSPKNCRRVDHAVSEIIIGPKVPVAEPSRDFGVLKLEQPVTAYKPLRLGSAGMVSSARGGGRITIAGFAGHRSTGLGRDLTVVTCRGYPMPLWDPIWTSAASLMAFDCDTATGMSGSAITVVEGGTRYLVGIAHSSMNLSEGKSFNLKDNFNFGYALEPTLGAAIACLHSGSGCDRFEYGLREMPYK